MFSSRPATFESDAVNRFGLTCSKLLFEASFDDFVHWEPEVARNPTEGEYILTDNLFTPVVVLVFSNIDCLEKDLARKFLGQRLKEWFQLHVGMVVGGGAVDSRRRLFFGWGQFGPHFMRCWTRPNCRHEVLTSCQK